MPTIGLSLIARDAGKTLRACLESVAPYVDQIVIGLGGPSTDDTEAIAREFTDEVYQLQWHDDFARARNEVWDKLTTDYGYWQDADDVLDGGENLRSLIAARPDVNCFFVPYHYERDEYGNLATMLWRERLVKNPHDYEWEGAIHEVLILDPSVPLVHAQAAGVVVRHNEHRDRAKGTRNLDILYRELERTEPQPSQRLLFYLYRENAARGNLKEALLHANRYISQARFDDESYQVACGIVRTLEIAGRFPEARKAAMAAIQMHPDWPDAFLALARLSYVEGKPLECIEWTKAGQTKQPPQTSVIIDPREYTYWPTYFLGLSYMALGDWEMALANFKNAASILPDEQLVALIDQAQRNLDTQRVEGAFLQIYETLGRYDEWLKARKLFESAPKLIESTHAVREAHLHALTVTPHIEDPQVMIDFYRNNPGWAPMDEEIVWSEGWAAHPRMAFARKSVTCDPPATILDIGSSDGFISLPLAKDGHIVEGWDLDPRCVDLANERAGKYDLRAHYSVGSIGDVEGKFDVAFAFEILEHLVDPDAFLDQVDEHARKVVITTPFLAWENGQVDWKKVEPKGHLRIFDLVDIETRLSHRGRIFDLYHESYGRSGWIFASYRPRQSYSRTVDFLAPGTLEEWSPRKLATEGLGGSETALIRLAEELFYAGGDDSRSSLCTVYGRIDSPGYYNGVRYRGVESYDSQTRSDVLVAWRYPEVADLPVRADRLVLWMHDTDAGERLTPARAARFDAIVVLSEWHKAHMLQTYPFIEEGKLVVIGNGVNRERLAPVSGRRKRGRVAPKREPHRVAYTSSPDRGLDFVLESVWPKVLEEVPDAELHVYYGWNNFDALAPSRPDLAAFRQKVANLMLDSKGVVQHGRVNQEVLSQELQKASVWLYPSRSPSGAGFFETFCISAVEAQLAGAIPVTTDRGALAETVQAGVIIDATIGTAEQYAEAVVSLLVGDEKQISKLRRRVRASAPAQGWNDVAGRWEEVLGGERRPEPERSEPPDNRQR